MAANFFGGGRRFGKARLNPTGTAAQLPRADVLAVSAAGAQNAELVRDSAREPTEADASNVLPFKRPL